MTQTFINKLARLSLVGLLACFTACNDDDSQFANPTADFSVETNELQATFKSDATYAVTLAWDFGDGQTSTKAWPVHQYSADGDYTVTLKAIGAEGTNAVAQTKTVTILQINPIASFTQEVNNRSVSFTNTSVRGVTYTWDFGDGNTSTDENPTHDYADSGVYAVTLTVTGADGATPSSVTVNIPVAVDAFIPIALENTDFSLPATGKLGNWEAVPGWSTDTVASDSGIENQEADGNWLAYKMSSDPDFFQLSNHVIEADQEFKLNVQAWETWNSTQAIITIYFDTGDGVRNVLATETYDINGDRNIFEVTATATAEAVGAKVGVAFSNIVKEGETNGWAGFDNVVLEVK